MDVIFNDLPGFFTTHLATIAATTLSMLAAALLAYFRGQISAGIKWALAPITRRLPWNQNSPIKRSVPDHESDLTSRLTVVDVFLTSMDGKSARYQKTCNYIVNNGDGLNSYQEGVTAAGKASGFSTMWGTIVETRKEPDFTSLESISATSLMKALGSKTSIRLTFTTALQTTKNTGLKKLHFQPNISLFEFTFQRADHPGW